MKPTYSSKVFRQRHAARMIGARGQRRGNSTQPPQAGAKPVSPHVSIYADRSLQLKTMADNSRLDFIRRSRDRLRR